MKGNSMSRPTLLGFALLLAVGMGSPAQGTGLAPPDSPSSGSAVDASTFLDLLRIADRDARPKAYELIARQWRPWYAPAVLEVLRVNREARFEKRLFALLAEKTGQSFGSDFDDWFRWIWAQEMKLPPQYTELKRDLYGLIDPRFKAYFDPERPSLIRLDEVRWGGVVQNGIPPLVNPNLSPILEAEEFADSDVVFGVVVGKEARAYPKRILAWHEMVRETVGGVPLTGVYCTLCGSMIGYRSEINGVDHELGTSGFLYRSNKLMFDPKTNSLWSTLKGKPVIGPLVHSDLQLERLSVVTTTFGEWKRRHPNSKVLSVATGYSRDYSEGAAYRDYFASPELMFGVKDLDPRLKKKDEVLAVLPASADRSPLAISSAFLRENPLYTTALGDESLLFLTDETGAARVYANLQGVSFARWDRDRSVFDVDGNQWTLDEAKLSGPNGETLPRKAAHRAFWFGWFAAFPKTRLIHK